MTKGRAWLTEYNGVGDNLHLFRQRTAPRDRDYRQRRTSGRVRALKASTVIRLKLPPAISIGFLCTRPFKHCMAEINARRLALPSRCFGIVTAARESPQFDFANSRKTYSAGMKQKLGHHGNE